MNRKHLLLMLIVLVGLPYIVGCADGKFVGADWVPTTMYSNTTLKDSESSAIYTAVVTSSVGRGVDPGMGATFDGQTWIVGLIGVDGKQCDVWFINRHPTDGKYVHCNKITELSPGHHDLTVILQTPFRAKGMGFIELHWLETKPIVLDALPDFEKGHIYKLIPDFSRAPSVVTAALVEVCASTNHVEAAQRIFKTGTCAQQFVQQMFPMQSRQDEPGTARASVQPQSGAAVNPKVLPNDPVVQAVTATAVSEPQSKGEGVGTTRPAHMRHLEASMLDGHTWTFAHPRDPMVFGNVRIVFANGTATASNDRSGSSGPYSVTDDMLCIDFRSRDWGHTCYYVYDEPDGTGGSPAPMLRTVATHRSVRLTIN